MIQVSSSISILEKVKEVTEGYVSNTGKNLGTMEGQVGSSRVATQFPIQFKPEIIQ